VSNGIVAQLTLETGLRFCPSTPGHRGNLGGTECSEAVDGGDADLDFGSLAVEVSCANAFAKGPEIKQVQRHRCERTRVGLFGLTRLRAWYPV
jgi:hypothetical protein